MNYSAFFVARVERSETRERPASVLLVPGFRSAPSGLLTNRPSVIEALK
jgi:hypothetical protein